MTFIASQSLSRVTVRPLVTADFDAVVALDQGAERAARRGYFDRRLAAAQRHPKRHLQLAAESDGKLVGFLLARRAGGEYGQADPSVVLEAVGVTPPSRHAGVGQQMVSSLRDLMRARGIPVLRTQVDWHNHAMLRFLDAARFFLAPRLVLERRVQRMPLPDTDEAIEEMPPFVRMLRAADFDAVARIDAAVTNADRREYLARKLEEALDESAIAVSLVAEDDGFVVGFAMARVDYGDFGHIEPVAELDTIGISPGHAHRGLARGLLTQMIDNLSALHVERLETEIAHDDLALLRFLTAFGFRPGARLSFQKRVLERA